ncbi:MAG: leucine--tRNA ligase [Parcubacteria group bacterium]|nr:leucine--tRNA ligase [Parcubacteria group bacterium]
MEKYNHKNIEAKWQKYWSEQPELYTAADESGKDKQYILDMFPYPSGNGLHAGHVESYTATDIMSRYLRLKGKNVLHPQGWDAFGLPAENYAIKTKIQPAITTRQAVATFKQQMKMMGFSYDWSRELNSSEPDYYKWTQWFFLLLYKNGLAYKKKAKVNWCASCQTVLANEQAEGGVCERCGHPVTQKDMEQWFFKITDFIEPSFAKATEAKERITSGLLDGLNKVDWPESTKAAQKNWIGKSEGAIIKFSIFNFQFSNKSQKPNGQKYFEVFTTRVDTIFGCTYLVVAPEHKILNELKLRIKNWPEVEKYLEQSNKKTDLERMESKEKTGVELKGIKAVNPFNGQELPLFVADYVLAHYGTGAIMAVPAHDQRDFEFAKKYNLPIKQVVKPKDVLRSVVVGITVEERFKEELKRNGIKFEVGLSKNKREHIRVILGKKQIEIYIKLAQTYLKPDSWVEIIGSENIFIFKDRVIKNFSFNDKKILNICQKFEPLVKHYKSLWEMLEANLFYQGWICYVDDGVLVNSGEYNGLTSAEAREKMTEWLEKEKVGRRKINYKIRDWLVSRQRYWGAPIPIIYCRKCSEISNNQFPISKQIPNPKNIKFQTTIFDGEEYAMIPVPEKDLPVKLPTDVDFMPTGQSPLVNSESFHKVKCPVCGSKARRESDTMDTFVCSSWYYFRYADVQNKKEFAGKEMIKKWLPVDLYVGGAEHTVLHLLYARFFTKVLHNLGYIDFDEPFLKLRHQGIILAEDGRKMSKSLGNVVNPDEVVKQYGADALRLFEMFMGPLEDMKPWNTRGIIGQVRFLEKIWQFYHKVKLTDCGGGANKPCENVPEGMPRLLHKTIKKITEDIEALRFNTAIAQLMIFINFASKAETMPQAAAEKFLILLAPFAPHLAEELWANIKSPLPPFAKGGSHSIFKEKWPEYDKNMVKNETINLVIQINGKTRDMIKVSADISEAEAKKLALASEKIKKWLVGKEAVKIIFVKGKLVNIVIK